MNQYRQNSTENIFPTLVFYIQLNYYYVQGLKKFIFLSTSHSTFLKKLLDDVLYQTKHINQEIIIENMSPALK